MWHMRPVARLLLAVLVVSLLVFLIELWRSEGRFSRPPVAVRALLEPPGLRLPPMTPEGYVISGRVFDSQGRAPQGLVVMITIPSADGSASTFSTPIERDGTFVTRPLSVGTHPLQVRPPFEGNYGAASEGAFTMLNLVGTIADDHTGKPIPFGFAVVFSADPASWQSWASTSHIVQADGYGAFSIPARPGRYLAVALPPGTFPHSQRIRPDFEVLAQKAITVQLGARERQLLPLRLPRIPKAQSGVK
jgi:hypothetical protein